MFRLRIIWTNKYDGQTTINFLLFFLSLGSLFWKIVFMKQIFISMALTMYFIKNKKKGWKQSCYGNIHNAYHIFNAAADAGQSNSVLIDEQVPLPFWSNRRRPFSFLQPPSYTACEAAYKQVSQLLYRSLATTPVESASTTAANLDSVAFWRCRCTDFLLLISNQLKKQINFSCIYILNLKYNKRKEANT